MLAVRISLLDQTIRNEYAQHIDILPTSFHPFFNRSLEDQLSSPLSARLSWLRLIRTGRESTDSSIIDINMWAPEQAALFETLYKKLWQENEI